MAWWLRGWLAPKDLETARLSPCASQARGTRRIPPAPARVANELSTGHVIATALLRTRSIRDTDVVAHTRKELPPHGTNPHVLQYVVRHVVQIMAFSFEGNAHIFLFTTYI